MSNKSSQSKRDLSVSLINAVLKVKIFFAGIVSYLIFDSFWGEPDAHDMIRNQSVRNPMALFSMLALFSCIIGLFTKRPLFRASGIFGTGLALLILGILYVLTIPFSVFVVFILSLGIMFLCSSVLIYVLPSRDLRPLVQINKETEALEEEILAIRKALVAQHGPQS